MRKFGLFVFAAVLCCLAIPPEVFAAPEPEESHGFKALVFSKTAGFRHDSIDEGILAIQNLATAHLFEVDTSEDAGVFTDANLAQYDVVIFLNTTGDILNPDQQAAFERFIRLGKGFVGIHSATDTEYDWSFYGDLVGAYFESHPPGTTSATVVVADRKHPSTAALSERWVRTDEWYNFQSNPRGNVHVLASLDESTYSGGSMGVDHPIAWCQNFEGGRSWYTAGGHTPESFTEPEFTDHLLNGIEWAAGVIPGDCSATVDANWELVALDSETDNPIGLDVAPDGRVFFIELGGTVKIYKPESSSTVEAAQIPVFEGNEHGLLGIELDPAFETNGWVYIFHSPLFGTNQRLSRFTVVGDAIDLGTEEVLLEFPTTRSQCCHNAGSMTFDADGNLFLATGDDTNPFESSGYTPIDERAGRAPWDAQRSSGNTNDLRGKILRITPQADGSYTIPEGNLFPSDGSGGRPEIFVMGVRNPFRIAVDSETAWLYWGDVGPDAGTDSGTRGPRGYDEWNQAKAAGNYGWPYCTGDNEPYLDYDFGTSTSGSAFDCANPTNDSPNNTGELTLPASKPAWIWYPYGPSSDFPAITDGSGRTAM
ncbi:MAG: ThuA domain-containing protein, partial [Rhodothermales bacterium]|nr:ThuA domain-containing protein [Rhodothermales bacterium]